MKSKIILLIAGAAVVTLSFTFATSSQVDKKEVKATTHQHNDEPAGGFLSEDKL